MSQKPRLQQAPQSTDIEGWRQAISQGRLSTFRLEDLVAAIQDLGPLADQTVRNPLAKHLSDAIVKALRKQVSPHHPNNGEDIIYRAHHHLFLAALQPNSADGKGLRKAFGARVSYRVKDALATEYQHSRIPTEQKLGKGETEHDLEEGPIAPSLDDPAAATDASDEAATSLHPDRDLSLPVESSTFNPSDDASEADDYDGATARNSNRDLSLLGRVRDLDECIDIVRFMRAIPNERKRLAFYLHMDGVPFGSKRGYSIARALGVSTKTAAEWVDEVRAILQSNPEIQELQKASVGDRT